MHENDLTALTVDIVSSFVAANVLPPEGVAELIHSVHAALAAIESGKLTVAAEPQVERRTPAQIRKSIQPDHLISFIDGKSYRTLRRHLAANGHTPNSYRERFGLPTDYPLVAPAYSRERSEMAKALGLGRRRPTSRTS